MKKSNLFILVFAFILVSTVLVSAQNICCEETKAGAWCQSVPENQCLTTGTPTSCDQTTYCQRGTCIELSSGTCSQNVPKSLCEEKNGTWDPRTRNEIAVCQSGCCTFGDGAVLTTNAECKQLASDYGVDVNFNPSISDEFTCLALAEPDAKGACVLTGEYSKKCVMTSKQECATQKGNFNEGLLCTAPELEVDCAPDKINTRCEEDGKIYFLDSCGNLANVYDASKATDTNDYWTFIQEPECTGRNCGDCDYGFGGTICREYKADDYSTAGARPVMGDYVCANLGCQDKNTGQTYEHGESWCAENPGTLFHINVSSDSKKYTDNTRAILDKDYAKYNLPGSEYTKLSCYNGEIIPETCAPFRNEVCVEYTYGEETENFRGAECQTNLWRDCFGMNDSESCEDVNQDCKWIEGYRFDQAKVTEVGDRNSDFQGSCVPLFAPGFDFWNNESEDSQLCSLGNVVENAVYETGLFRSRDKFEEANPQDAASRCLENCYLIPGYANPLTIVDMETKIWNGEQAKGNTLWENFLSIRRGQYCEGETGKVTAGCGLDIISSTCAERVDCDLKEYPIFFTHEELLNSIRERARSIGDCGYKVNLIGDSSDVESEIFAAVFQKLNQDGTPKDGEENAVMEVIYRGDETKIYNGTDGGYRGVGGEE